MDDEVDIDCSICLSVLQDPCTLPCGHTFCLSCISDALDTATRRRCPLCSASVPPGHQLRVSILARNLVQTVLARSGRATAATPQQTSLPPVVPLPAPPGLTLLPQQHVQQQQHKQQQFEQRWRQQAAAREQERRQRRRQSQQEPEEERQQQVAASEPPAAGLLQQLEHRPAASGAQPPASLLQAGLRRAADALAAAAQLIEWLLLSPAAGAGRDTAWAVLGVLLPPALAVWGRGVLQGLALTAAAVALAARRRWGVLALLLPTLAAADAALQQRGCATQQHSRPAPAPW